MALIETATDKKSDKKEKQMTKIIVRRLPPSMSEEQFLSQIQPLAEHNYMYYVRGDMSLAKNSFSRAYINFNFAEDVYAFKEKFDNYVFVDNRGHEYSTVVEFASFQKVPKKRGGKLRKDPKCGTIESDTSYLEFLDIINRPIEPEAKAEFTLQLVQSGDKKKSDITTPLLEYLKTKRAQKQVRREEMKERRKREYERRKEMQQQQHTTKYNNNYDEKTQGKKILGNNNNNNNNKSPQRVKTLNSSSSNNTEVVVVKSFKNKPFPSDEINKNNKEKKEIKPRFPKKEFTTSSTTITENKRGGGGGEDHYSSSSNNSHNHHHHHHQMVKQKSSSEEFYATGNKQQKNRVKKYSEKREERKILEAQQKKLNAEQIVVKENEIECFDQQQQQQHQEEEKTTSNKEILIEDNTKIEQIIINNESCSSSSSSSRRIRNKDRPTIALYRPGMLTKKKQADIGENINKDKDEPKVE